MKRNVVIPTLLIVLLYICVASCKKSTQTHTLFTDMFGKWRLSQFATDDNNNGLIDPYEIQTQPAADVRYLTFRSDSTGIDSSITDGELSSKIVLGFKWYVFGDSLSLVYPNAHFSQTYYIVNVNGHNLDISATDTTGLAAYYFTK